MELQLVFVLLLMVALGIAASIDSPDDKRWKTCSPGNRSIYDFEVEDLLGNKVNLSEFRGKMLLIINVATYCAYTKQYEDFNPLVNGNVNLHILAFPCNQFASQEPGENSEILNGLKYVRPGNGWEPDTNVHMFGKLEVNGENEHPLYTYLKSLCPQTSLRIGNPKYLIYNPIRVTDVTWNFEKFLIDENGNLRYRYHPSAWNGGKVVQKHIDNLRGKPVEQ